MISLDLPGGYHSSQVKFLRKFASDKKLVFVRADSHQKSTYRHIRDEILYEDSLGTRRNVDFLFIDGDHTYTGVKQDFEMYSQLVSDGGIIAFHDIVHFPNDRQVVEHHRETVGGIENRHLRWSDGFVDCNVDRLWNEIRDEFKTREIISHPKQSWAGIGVIFKIRF